MELRVLPLPGLPEVRPGDDLAALIARVAGGIVEPGDVVVVTQKIVSKAEGRLVDLNTVEPSERARAFAAEWERDARQVELVLRESVRIVRMEHGLVISETAHGFVCANAGVDVSNTARDVACLLPADPDASAARLRDALQAALRVPLAVVISDTFGRPWRFGITNVAIGVAGLRPIIDYRGRFDPVGYELKATVVAVADEMAGAAELVMGKTSRVPVAIVRGWDIGGQDGAARELILDPARDLFR